MAQVKPIADAVRENRRPVDPDNVFLAAQTAISTGIVDWLERCRETRDSTQEHWFRWFYGLPIVQAALGLSADHSHARPKTSRDAARTLAEANRRMAGEKALEDTGVYAAAIRALFYIEAGRKDTGADERGFRALRALRQQRPAEGKIGLQDFKALVRRQHLAWSVDPERAIAHIPAMAAPAELAEAFAWLSAALKAAGRDDEETRHRLHRIEALMLSGESGKRISA